MRSLVKQYIDATEFCIFEHSLMIHCKDYRPKIRVVIFASGLSGSGDCVCTATAAGLLALNNEPG